LRDPVTRVFFAHTCDPQGPHGAKSMAEAAINPVPPALANAIRDAVGMCPDDLPLTPDRVWEQLEDARTATDQDSYLSGNRLTSAGASRCIGDY